MIKLIIFIIGIGTLVGLSVWGIQNFLSIDDLQNCDAPNPLSAKCAPADAIVAISGGDTPARTSEAIALYQAGWAPKVVFSGAAADTSGPSNAAAMRRQALAAGVPDSAILIDEKAADTIQNASRTLGLISGARRIILVTSPYHQRRANAEFQKIFGDSVTIVNHPTSSDHLWPQTWWLTASGWWLGLSESVKTAIVLL